MKYNQQLYLKLCREIKDVSNKLENCNYDDKVKLLIKKQKLENELSELELRSSIIGDDYE